MSTNNDGVVSAAKLLELSDLCQVINFTGDETKTPAEQALQAFRKGVNNLIAHSHYVPMDIQRLIPGDRFKIGEWTPDENAMTYVVYSRFINVREFYRVETRRSHAPAEIQGGTQFVSDDPESVAKEWLHVAAATPNGLDDFGAYVNIYTGEAFEACANGEPIAGLKFGPIVHLSTKR